GSVGTGTPYGRAGAQKQAGRDRRYPALVFHAAFICEGRDLMSFQAMAWAVKQQPSGSKEKFVLLMLANYASNEKGDCHPSINEISDTTMLSKDSVIRALKSLEDDGLISIHKQRVGRVNLANTYTLNMQGVVAHSDHRGSSTQQGGSRKSDPEVVAHSDPNLSQEPIKAKPREWTRKELDLLETKLREASSTE